MKKDKSETLTAMKIFFMTNFANYNSIYLQMKTLKKEIIFSTHIFSDLTFLPI